MNKEKLKTVIVNAYLSLDVDIPIDSTEEYINSIKEEAWNELSRSLYDTDFLIEEITLMEV